MRGGSDCLTEEIGSRHQPYRNLNIKIPTKAIDLKQRLCSRSYPIAPKMTEIESAELKLQLDGVSEPLVQALIASGVKSLTPVQLATLPHCLAGNDVLAKAKTGTGKTLAFLIPTVERVLKSGPPQLVNGRDPIRALVLSSTRELANQIVAQAERLLALVPGFNVECVLGGSSIIPQRERLDPDCIGQFRYGGAVDLMVATPGRLIEHMDSTAGIEDRLRGVATLVLDEADQLLDGGFQRAIERIISALPSSGRQTLCFSATVPERLAGVLRGALRADHTVVDCVGEDAAETHAAIDQTCVVHTLEQSMLALYLSLRDEMAARPDDHKVLVFLPTARQTQFTAAVLAEVGVEVLEIHSRRSQGERTAASDAFRGAARAVMLTSDVSARGVDYPDVTLVLQVPCDAHAHPTALHMRFHIPLFPL
jgi:superfamily II DNA/RNA helicase